MRDLTAREVLSLCLVVLLRLVRVPCPDPRLKRWFEVDVDYVDSLISLATRHTGPLDSFVLDTVLDPDRWTLSFEVLGTCHDVLYSSWTAVYSSLLHSNCSGHRKRRGGSKLTHLRVVFPMRWSIFAGPVVVKTIRK